MRNIFTILLTLCAIGYSYGQDILVLKSKEEIKGSVQEINADSIKFLRDTDEMLTVAKADVHKIVFSSGIEEYFGNSSTTDDYYYDHKDGSFNEKKDFPNGGNHDRIYLMDGGYIDGEVLEKKRFGINYIALEAPETEISYIANTKVSKIVYAGGTVEYISGSALEESTGKKKKDPKDFSYLSPHYVSLAIGPSIPFGMYSANAGLGGYAGIGADFHADITYYLFRGLGFSTMVGGTFNVFKDNNFRSYMSTTFPNSNIKIGQWWHAYTLGGIGYYNDFGRVLIDYKVLIGAMYSFFPGARADYTDSLGQSKHVTLTSKSIGFTFGAHTALRYYITRKWAVKASLTMMFARCKFPGIVRREYTNGQFTSEQLEPVPGYGGVFDMQISQFSLQLGVAYILGK